MPAAEPTSARRPVRIGVLACGRYAHTPAVLAPIIEPGPGVQRRTSMRLTHVWDVDRAVAQEFADAYDGVCVVEAFDAMVGEVDGVILDDFDSCQYFRQLARPYLEAGVPMFINRPFAYSLADARAILDLAAAHDAPIMSGSSYEFAPELPDVRGAIADLGPLSKYSVVCGTTDFATHGVHGLFLAHACMGGAIRSAAYQTADWRAPGGVVTIQHEARDGERSLIGSVHGTAGGEAVIRVASGTNSLERTIPMGGDDFLPMLLVLQTMIETRQMPQSYESLYRKTQLFLAAFRSHVACGGAPVDLDAVGDWTAPQLHTDPYPRDFFA